MNKHSLDNKQKPFYLSIDDISPYVRFVSEYLLEVRISKAREFLEDSDLNISQIALKVGFDSVRYFSLSFKKLVGFSPRHYRELMQQSTNSGIYLAAGSLKELAHKLKHIEKEINILWCGFYHYLYIVCLTNLDLIYAPAVKIIPLIKSSLILRD